MRQSDQLHVQVKDPPVWPELASSFSVAMQSLRACGEVIEFAKEMHTELQYLKRL